MTEPAERDAVVLERRLSAPAEVIWQLWTDPEHFAQWYGPSGATVSVITMDVRVGGARHIAMEMTTPRGPMRMWLAGEHLEVVPPERLVYTDARSDADGNILSPEAAGMPPGYPAITEVHLELRESAGTTTLTLTHVGVPADSPAASGWTAALDKLEARLLDCRTS
jgi:uncharacterized protein YndB with AHSA1/START domain